jgi:DNA-binding NarL/FixJ family response regulator
MNAEPNRRDTVLVVDDQPDTLRLITDTLDSAGLTVLVATSGGAALDLLAHVVPDLVLMDAVMPFMDGFQTTRLIKANPATAHVPVIFMTGLTESEHVVQGFEVGGADYVRKPVNVDELVARVRVHLMQARAVQASTASLDATGRLMLATDTRGTMLWCTPLAERAIMRFAPGWNREQTMLPDVLRLAVERLLARSDSRGANIRLDHEEGTLELVLIAQYRENEVLIRLNAINLREDAARLQERLGLTERESEVLLWISYGKSNADISDVLIISPRTVQKHLERIYEKLGVETRAAAAAMAIRSGDQ